jgi:hypothetical protein
MRFKPEWARFRETSRMGKGIWIGAALAVVMAAPASAAPSDVVYGGVTPQGWPVVVQLSHDRRTVTKLVVALPLKCGHGAPIVNRDSYAKLKLSKSGRFSDTYGPVTTDNGDGTTTDYRGSVSGTVAASKIVASSRLSGAFYDATGTLTDTCDSGTVKWTAKP